ncbi:MAG: response regulator transcription factor [Anaerolineae bacterium]|nr:response regulator transcription factor [Anaerolineae bacterium]
MTIPIRIFIADDHPIVREGLHALISTEASMTIVGEAADGEDTVRRVRELKPDVILMDLIMGKMDGIEAIERIKLEDPGARILALTSFTADDIVFPAIKAGALGYLLKDSAPQELLQAIINVYQGVPSLAPSIALKLFQELHHPEMPAGETNETLTEREVLILKHVAQGLTNQEIASLLVISERTVRNHVGSILSKLHLANRTQAALYALREGIARLDEPAKTVPPEQ